MEILKSLISLNNKTPIDTHKNINSTFPQPPTGSSSNGFNQNAQPANFNSQLIDQNLPPELMTRWWVGVIVSEEYDTDESLTGNGESLDKPQKKQ